MTSKSTFSFFGVNLKKKTSEVREKNCRDLSNQSWELLGNGVEMRFEVEVGGSRTFSEKK